MKISFRKARSYLYLTSSGLVLAAVLAAPPSLAQESGTPEAQGQQTESPAATSQDGPVPPGSDEGSGVSSTDENREAIKESQAAEPKTKPRPAIPDAEPLPLSHKHESFVSLKAGQKLRIAGFAEQQEAKIVDPGPESQTASNYHQARMRLTGSMCFACLKELQEKLKQVFGVERVIVEKSNTVSIQSYSPDLANYADADIVYDASKLDFIDLRAYIKTNGYFPYKVNDKSIDALPAERKKKSES